MIAREGVLFVVDGRYRVLRQLGSGGMAVVYLADDTKTGRPVALKLIKDSKGIDAGFLRRLRREYKLCSKIRHRNLVSLYALGSDERASFYVVMEFVEGMTLDRYASKKKRLSGQEVLKLFEQMIFALIHLHRAGVVHRDLKPQNMMVENGSGRLVVMDFGLARGMDVTALTETGAFLGTPNYMSPDLIETSSVDARSDIYQIGLITYELLTGVNPFSGNNIAEVLQKVAVRRVVPVSKYRSDLSPFWDTLLARAMAYNVDERFQTAEELLAALESGNTSPYPGVGSAGKSFDGRRTIPMDKCRLSSSVTEKQAGRKRPGPARLLAGLSAVVLLTLVVLFLFHWKGSDDDRGRGGIFDFRLRKVTVVKDRIRLSWSSSPVRSARVAIVGEGKALWAGAADPDARGGAVLLPRPDSRADDIIVDNVLPSGDSRRRHLGKALAVMIDGMAEPLRALDINSLADELAPQTSDTIALYDGATRWSRRHERIGSRLSGADTFKVIDDRLRTAGVLDCYQRVSKLAFFVLGTRIMPIDDRQRFYEALAGIRSLYFAVAFNGNSLDLRSWPSLADWDTAETRLSGSATGISIFKRKSDYSIKLSNRAVLRMKKSRASWMSRFRVASLKGVFACQIRFLLRPFSSLAFRLKINDCFSVLVADLPVLRGDPTVADNTHYLYQRLPVDALNEGNNVFYVEIAPLFGRLTDDKVKLKAVDLFLFSDTGTMDAKGLAR